MAVPGEMVSVPAGAFEMGAAPGAFAYDNELPRHVVETAAFEIGRYPVTNGEYVDFVAAGGYGDRRAPREGHSRTGGRAAHGTGRVAWVRWSRVRAVGVLNG